MPETGRGTVTGPEPRGGSDQAAVLSDIRAHPGSKGVDIVRRLEAKGIKERTIRTAIHRLKKRGAIIQQMGKWCPVDARGWAILERGSVKTSLDEEEGQARQGA